MQDNIKLKHADKQTTAKTGRQKQEKIAQILSMTTQLFNTCFTMYWKNTNRFAQVNRSTGHPWSTEEEPLPALTAVCLNHFLPAVSPLCKQKI